MEKEYKVGEKIKLGNVTLEVVGLDDYECGTASSKDYAIIDFLKK